MRTASASITGAGLESLVMALKKELHGYVEYRYDNVVVLFAPGQSRSAGAGLLLSVILDFRARGRCDVRIVSGVRWRGVPGPADGPGESLNDDVLGLIRDLCRANEWQLIAGR